MAISVYLHDSLPLTLVAYSGTIEVHDFEIFAAFFRDPEIFPLDNIGLCLIEETCQFSEIEFASLMKLGKRLEHETLIHQQAGRTPPAEVPLIIPGTGLRIVSRLWAAVTDLVPDMKPKYRVFDSPQKAVTALGLEPDIAAQIKTRAHFRAQVCPKEIIPL